MLSGSSWELSVLLVVLLFAESFAEVLNLFAQASKPSADGAAGVGAVGAGADGADGAGGSVSIRLGAAAPVEVLSAGRFEPLELLPGSVVFCFLGSFPTSSKAICVAFKGRLFSRHAAEC